MKLHVHHLGLQAYTDVWHDMQYFTEQRTSRTDDEIWFVQHPPVFTLGKNGNPDDIHNPEDIPVVKVDRGGQVTYHGPGQLMIYPLIDLKRARLGVRSLVTALEQTVVDLSADYGVAACSRSDAPGVYVQDRKIASVGLRVRRGASYHGMALNIDLDLEPFSRINPCGFSDLEVTDLQSVGIQQERNVIQAQVQNHLLRHLHLEDRQVVNDY